MAVEATDVINKASQIAQEHSDKFLVDLTHFPTGLVLTAFTRAISKRGDAYHLVVEIEGGRRLNEVEVVRFDSGERFHLRVYPNGQTEELATSITAGEAVSILHQLVRFKIPRFKGMTLREFRDKYGYREEDPSRLLET